MSVNCVNCVKNKRTGSDLLCDSCRDKFAKRTKTGEFFKNVFLTCPIHGDFGYVEKVESDHFIVKCQKTSWKVSFKITEV